MRPDIALIPLEKEVRATLTTAEAAAHLNRAEQTLRFWAMGTVKSPIQPRRVNGRLAWPVAELKKLLGVEEA
ncbi:hypothetical protein GCM10023165_42790 [Variovorax defluvii]|uniref:DNA-binding protein n=1 Tax=Variovorax defluvii TaxID=913761 RepID=A0ABP8I7Z6_9BURK